LRLPAAGSGAFLELVDEVGMVLFDHFAKLLHLVVLGGLLTKLCKRDLLVVIDDQQGDDARLELLALQAGAADLPRLGRLTGLSKLARLSGLNWLDRARLRGAWLGRRLGLLCQH
jgi:hypothetical protein